MTTTKTELQKERVSSQTLNSDQGQLELAIMRYQEAHKNSNSRNIDVAYEQICNLYQPLSYVHVWFKKYRYLYDTREDFFQDYLRIFCTSLVAWTPRHLRKKSRYDGTGDFKNFFWSALNHNYINMVKADASGKRNLSTQCPICNEWCNPLSTHLRKKHEELLWEQMAEYELDVQHLLECPFCKSHKAPKSADCSHQERGSCESCLAGAKQSALKSHILSMHSTFLFERFRNLYPQYTTLSPRPESVNKQQSMSGEEMDLYDHSPSDNRLSGLLDIDLSTVQLKIIEKILQGGRPKINYDFELYNCSQESFNQELEDLKTKMILCGLESKDND